MCRSSHKSAFVLLCLTWLYILFYWSTFKPGCFCLSKLMKGLHTMQQKPADLDLAELMFSFPPPKQVSQLLFFCIFFPSRASHFLLYSPTSQKDCFEDGEQSSIFWMFSLSGILNPVLHYGGSTLWVIEDATSSSLFRFNTDDKQFVIGVTFCSRSMITRAGKSDFPALMMTIKLEIDDNCFWRKACWPASPMKTCFIWMKMGKLNLESSTSNCVLSTFHIILFANLVKKNLRQNRCKCASVSVIIKIYAASQSDPQTRTENAEQGKIQDLASEYWLNS